MSCNSHVDNEMIIVCGMSFSWFTLCYSMLQFAVELSTKRRIHKLYMQLLLILFISLVLSSLVDFNLNVMEKVNLQYSMKNIPIPSKHEYKKMLVAKTEHLIKRMRWKVLAFDGKLKSSNKNTYGFRTSLHPEPSPDLVQFESDLMDMISNIEFRPIYNDFQASKNAWRHYWHQEFW